MSSFIEYRILYKSAMFYMMDLPFRFSEKTENLSDGQRIWPTFEIGDVVCDGPIFLMYSQRWLSLTQIIIPSSCIALPVRKTEYSQRFLVSGEDKIQLFKWLTTYPKALRSRICCASPGTLVLRKHVWASKELNQNKFRYQYLCGIWQPIFSEVYRIIKQKEIK